MVRPGAFQGHIEDVRGLCGHPGGMVVLWLSWRTGIGQEEAPLANQGGEEWGWVVRAGYMAQGGQSS